MFALQTFLGNALTREWAETRARWEPMYEITQIKGDGETHPTLSPTDEFASFEKWDQANLAGSAEAARHAGARVRPTGAPGRAEARADARRESVQVRLRQRDRHAHGAEHRRGRQLLRQAHGRRADARTAGSTRSSRPPRSASSGGRCRPPATPVSGPPRTPARRSGTRSSARRRTRPPARASACASSAAGTSMPRTPRRGCPPRPDTPRVCPWAATSPTRPPARRRPSWSPRSRIRSAGTSTATRSSRAGSMPRASCTRRSMTWPGPATGRSARTASCRRWATPSTWRMHRGRTRSARRSWSPSGKIPTSIRVCAPSTTAG